MKQAIIAVLVMAILAGSVFAVTDTQRISSLESRVTKLEKQVSLINVAINLIYHWLGIEENATLCSAFSQCIGWTEVACSSNADCGEPYVDPMYGECSGTSLCQYVTGWTCQNPGTTESKCQMYQYKGCNSCGTGNVCATINGMGQCVARPKASPSSP